MRKRLTTGSVIVALLLSAGGLQAQRPLWGGLQEPQPKEVLPVAKTPIVWPERVAKRPAGQASLLPDGTLSGGWELRGGRSGEWFDATVPGTVLTTLVDQGVYPDPCIGLNNLAIPDSLARTDWWYRCRFDTPPRKERMWLIFEGINYAAEILLNGEPIGRMTGAFRRGRFEVTSHLGKRNNLLEVHILPPPHAGIPHEQSVRAGQGLNGGATSLDGPTFIASVGWDWMPAVRDRNMGIWQPVRLVATGDVTIGDALVTTDLPLPDTTSVRLAVRVPLRNHADRPVDGVLRVDVGQEEATLDYALQAGEEREFTTIVEMKNPRLWWPNGYGEQALYTARITVDDSDSRSARFGIRELSYELMVQLPGGAHKRLLYTPSEATAGGSPFDYVKRGRYDESVELPTLRGSGNDFFRENGLRELPGDDPVGPYLVIRVNGRRIFCRGGNWGMDDVMKRVSRERLEPYLRLHREAGFNMIRNWTGESTEEVFYTLCDEYGMMVWNDFWITTDDTVEPIDPDLFLENAADVVARYRNHPSIVLWCPRNEGFAPLSLEERLPALVASADPTRHYHGQSRYLNMGTSGPWSYFEEPARYTELAKGFITEIGTYSIPTAETIRKFIGAEELWPIGDVWAYHDLHHTSQNFEGFLRAVERYGRPTGMEDFSRRAQFVCYDAWRAIVEAWNSRMWHSTTGQLLWMSHPAWPSMIWQTYTYDYETPGSYFGAKKASEPLHVQMNPDDRTVMVVNNTRHAAQGLEVSILWIDPLTGGELDDSTFHGVDAPAGTATEVAPATRVDAELCLVRLELRKNGKLLSVNDYWEGDVANIDRIPPTGLAIEWHGGAVEVRNTGKSMAIHVKLKAVDVATGRTILPAYFSDGYFNLLPDEGRTIEVDVPHHDNYFKIITE